MNKPQKAKQQRPTAQGFSTYLQNPTPSLVAPVPTILEEVKQHARSLGIKGWNFYTDIEKLQAKIDAIIA